MKKHLRLLSLFVCVAFFVGSFSLPAAAASSVSTFNELASAIASEISKKNTSFTVNYTGSGMNDMVALSAFKTALTQQSLLTFTVSDFSVKAYSGYIRCTVSYTKNSYESVFSTSDREIKTILSRAISQRRSGINIYLYSHISEADLKNNLRKYINEILINPVDDYDSYIMRSIDHSVKSSSAFTNDRYGFLITFDFYYDESLNETRAVDDFINRALKTMNLSSKSDNEKALAINNYIINYTEYKDTGSRADYIPYGLIQSKSGYCHAFALLTGRMLDAAGVKNRIVTGEWVNWSTGARVPHMWNAVKIGSEWKFLDVSINDLLGSNDYFLVSREKINEGHIYDAVMFSDRALNQGLTSKENQRNLKVVLEIGKSTMTVGQTTKQVDSANKNVMPIIYNDRTYIPLRSVLEAVGASVAWVGKDSHIIINYRGCVLDMWLNSNRILIGGKEQYIEQPPLVQNDRTLIPIRLVSELLGIGVDWDSRTREVTITPL